MPPTRIELQLGVRKQMGKLTSHLLHMRLGEFLLYLLALWSIPYMLLHSGCTRYSRLTRDQINASLYRQLNPTLVHNPTKPDCRYEVTKASKPLHNIVIPSKFDNFLATGIENGSYSPPYCRPAFSVALVVPYRNRQQQLEVFLPYMHNFLRKQDIHYKIFIVEQEDGNGFNRGALMNVGAQQAIAEQFPCIITHDVDLLPLDETNLYACLQQPRHLSVAVDRLRLVLPYAGLAGGVLAARADQFAAVNGYSNDFFGWGAEDDDFSARLLAHKLKLLRFPSDMSRYSMLAHARQPGSAARFSILARNKRQLAQEGLNSVRVRAQYITHYTLFTLIRVKFDNGETM